MLLYLFARCSFLFEALLGKGRGEVEGEGEGGRGRGGRKGRWGPSFAATWPCHGLSLITVMSSEEEFAHSFGMEYKPMAVITHPCVRLP